MKLHKLLLVGSLLLLALPGSAQVPVASSIAYDPANASNQIVLTWESIPTKLYQVLTTAALGQQPWVPLTPTPVYSSNNLARFHDTNNQPARFYQVVKLDTEPPEIWRLNPASNSIAVALQSGLQVQLQDETGINPASIALTVGMNPPVGLTDPGLSLVGNLLTYTPATNQFLGTNGQTITNQIVVADTLGHRVTNSWPITLELVPILADNVVLITPTSSLSLVSTNGDTYVFSYDGASSGLTNGAIVVSTDADFPYKRLVLSVTDDPVAHTVSLITTQAALVDVLVQGSVRFYGAEFVPEVAGLRQAQSGDGITVDLGGYTLFDNGKVQVQTTAGRLFFDSEFAIAAEFRSPRTFDLDISAEMAFDLTLRAAWEDNSSFAPDPLPIGRPLRFRLSGCIPIGVFCIPVWVEAVWKFSIGTEGEVSGLATATAGFESSRSVAFGARLRDGQWAPYSNESSTAVGSPATWQGTGSGRIRGFVEPKLTMYLESLVGPTANLRTYLELVANACLQPGQEGVAMSLFPGLNGTLALALRGWDKDWDSLPSWEIFSVRPATPLWHELFISPNGPAPTVAGNLVWIPCGTFTMGSPPSEPGRSSSEGPQTRVTISQGFWMGQYEVTQGEYLAVMGDNPSYFRTNDSYGNLIPADLSRPVERVSWNNAMAYCAALTAREHGAGRLPAGYVYRLPTEAEWEYACRAGTTTPFYYGDALRSGMANFDGYYEYPPCGDFFRPQCGNPDGINLARTTKVGSYAPNAWGLYDMHGNVWEWCQNIVYTYPGGSVTDPNPQGPPMGPYRVYRGGGVNWYSWLCRSANRRGDPPYYQNSFLGFRVVLAPGQP